MAKKLTQEDIEIAFSELPPSQQIETILKLNQIVDKQEAERLQLSQEYQRIKGAGK